MVPLTTFGLILLKALLQASVYPCNGARVCDLKELPSYRLEFYENIYSNFVQKPFQAPRHMVNDTDIVSKFRSFLCGRMAVDLPSSSAAAGVSAAPAKSFPWHVVLNFHSSFTCGGVLITNYWVLTVASCLIRGVRSVSFWSSKVEISIVSRVTHVDYNDLTGENDIALIKIDPAASYNEFIRPACFPNIFMNLTTAATCYISGFAPGTQESLKYSPVYVMPQEICSYAWKTRDYHVDRRSICGDYSTPDVCYDDLGNPLTCLVDGRYYIVGMVDRYMGHCNSSDFPMTFIRVFEFADWIFTTIVKYSKYD
ncbi:hypothetical protein Btru_039356 [Bulinus truncatus]|nr:hypothetical protein Btru_039356 [Bulinus truncatus]